MRRALLAIVGASALAACSVLLDTSSSQCASTDDCRNRGAAFATSICKDSRCVAQSDVACTTNKECVEAIGGPAICRSRDRKCGALLSAECTHVVGDVTDDNVIVLGSIFTVTGTNGPAGQARENSAEVALNEIKLSVGGIRATADATPHPLAIVACDDNLDSVIPATHLIDDVGVPAIIGIASSTRVTDVATKVSIPKGVLLISPTATSVTLTTLQDNNLVWQTAPSDALQVIALLDQLPAMEAVYRTANAVPAATSLRIDFVYLNDAYGLGLYSDVATQGQLNGKPLSDPANTGLATGLSFEENPVSLDSQVSAILAQNPRPAIIAGFGSTEIVTELIGPLEAQWGTTPRPLYLFADAVEKQELLDLVATNDDLRKRIRGTAPSAGYTSNNFKAFAVKYEGMFKTSAMAAFGMAGTYDSVFLIAYSIAAAGQRPITGDELQKGFGRLVSGAIIDVGGASMNAGFQALVTPGSFDFEGASGPLDFDLKTGEAPSNIDVWCIAKDALTHPEFLPSGRFFDARAKQMTGTFDVSAGTCQQQ